MPVPRPYPREKTDVFVSRCISQLSHSDTHRPQDQIAAICFAQARKFGRIIKTPSPKEKAHSNLESVLASKK